MCGVCRPVCGRLGTAEERLFDRLLLAQLQGGAHRGGQQPVGAQRQGLRIAPRCQGQEPAAQAAVVGFQQPLLIQHLAQALLELALEDRGEILQHLLQRRHLLQDLGQLPPLDDYDIALGRTYLYLRDTPLYPFGHGLSYTQFAYRNLRLNPAGAAPAEPVRAADTAGAAPALVIGTNDTLNVTVEITNTGDRAGEEVVQLYIRNHAAPAPTPLQQLRAFRRVQIPARATRPVDFALKMADLGYWHEGRQAFVVAPGPYEILIGASSADVRLLDRFLVK